MEQQPEIIAVTKLSHAKGYDANGNSRRLFVIQRVTPKGSERIEVINEGSMGNRAWQEKYPNAVWMAEYMLPASEWQVYKRMVGKE